MPGPHKKPHFSGRRLRYTSHDSSLCIPRSSLSPRGNACKGSDQTRSHRSSICSRPPRVLLLLLLCVFAASSLPPSTLLGYSVTCGGGSSVFMVFHRVHSKDIHPLGAGVYFPVLASLPCECMDNVIYLCKVVHNDSEWQKAE